MKRELAAISIIGLLIISAHRLPAPIEEETPSPTPAQSASPSATAVSQLSKKEAARFAGTWIGKIKFGGYANEVDHTLIVNPEATSLILKSPRIGEISRPATVTAGTLSWRAGARDANLWTLTPNPDGQSAVVNVKPASGAEGRATFQRGEPVPKRGGAGARRQR